MKTKPTLKLATALVSLATISAQISTARAQGTAFSYQGRLNDHGGPANGSYDLRFKLFVDSLGNTQTGSAIAITNVPVANGLFQVSVDFGAGVFNGTYYWLEVDVRTNGLGAYINLSPLQAVTPAPYAIFAENAGNGGFTGGTYTNVVTLNNAADQFIGTFAGNGSGLTNANAATLGGLSASNFWKTSGNTGTAPGTNFLGTTDRLPLELWVNQSRAWRLEPDTNNIGAPNVIGGAPNNFVDPGVYGATIAGGGVLNYLTNGFEPGPGSNHVSAIWGTIGGGRRNTVAADHSTIGGGHDNVIQAYAYDSVIGGGEVNTIANFYGQSVIAGGSGNRVAGNGGSVGGGYSNSSQGYASTVPGGYLNTASGDYSFAAGQFAAANHPGAFVWSDASTFSSFSSTASNQFNVRANGGVRFVTGGVGLTIDGPIQASSFLGSGASLTSLDAGNISSGTLADGRLSGNVALLNANQTFSGFNIFGDLSMEGGQNYHHFQLSGGNALGYLYGSFLKYGDGIHLGYNYYADAIGGSHIFNSGGGTSRLSLGYNSIVLATGVAGVQPNYNNIVINGTITTINGTFQNNSDRNAKQDFATVSPTQVLDAVVQLPISEWSYKAEPETRHVGPMAQDFHAAFSLGTDETHIAPMDEGGVALAAIQGLNQKLQAELQRRDEENAELKQETKLLQRRIEALEQSLRQLQSD
jgi:hypothetical protein